MPKRGPQDSNEDHKHITQKNNVELQKIATEGEDCAIALEPLDEIHFTQQTLSEKLTKNGISKQRYEEEKQKLLNLDFSEDQADSIIIRKSSKNTVAKLVALLDDLIVHFDRAQLTKIAKHGGGSKNLNAVKDNLEALQKLGFSAEQIVKMVAHSGGSKNLIAVKDNQEALQKLGFSAEQIVKMVAHNGGSNNLNGVKDNLEALQKLGFSAEEIVKIVSHIGGSNNLNAVKDNQEALQKLGFRAEDIVNMVAHGGGSQNLIAVKDNLRALQIRGISIKKIVKIASRNGGSLKIKSLVKNTSPLPQSTTPLLYSFNRKVNQSTLSMQPNLNNDKQITESGLNTNRDLFFKEQNNPASDNQDPIENELVDDFELFSSFPSLFFSENISEKLREIDYFADFSETLDINRNLNDFSLF